MLRVPDSKEAAESNHKLAEGSGSDKLAADLSASSLAMELISPRGYARESRSRRIPS